MKKVLLASLLCLGFATPAMAKVYTDIAFVSLTGSDTNDCVWKAPFTSAMPKPCKTATHAATLLKGPGSALEFMTGTYAEHVVINANNVSWPNEGASLSIEKFTGATVEFDGGTITVNGNGFVDIRGIKMINCPSDCITYQGTSAAQPLQGRIEDEDIYGSLGHIIMAANTNALEIGYNFFSDPVKSHIHLINSPNYNVHETSTLMTVKKTPQHGGHIIDSPGGLYDTHSDSFVAPNSLHALRSPHISTIPDVANYTANICPSTDVATDMFVSNWSVKSACPDLTVVQ